MTCDHCESDFRVVYTQDGNFCEEHYRAYKRGRAVGREVHQDTGESVDKDPIRIGGHDDC